MMRLVGRGYEKETVARHRIPRVCVAKSLSLPHREWLNRCRTPAVCVELPSKEFEMIV